MRRRLGAALLALAVVAACGGDEGSGGSTTTTVTRTGSSSTVAEEGTSTTAGGGGDDGTGTEGTPASGGSTTGGAPTDTAPPPEASLSPGAVGGLAAPLLRPGNGDRIVVEVRAQAGAEPRAATLQELQAMLRDVSGKTVVVDGVDPIPGGERSWSGGSIVRAADGAADHGQGGAQVVVRVLFVHGTYEGDGSVLGVAVRGDVVAVFTDQVDRTSGLLTSSAVVEHAVTIHEVGHLLGLVDLAIDTGRDDPEHPGHSTNQGSVMYWAVESDLVAQVLGGGVPTDLDAQDRADLARIRAG